MLKRPHHPMSEQIALELDERGLRAAYDERPPYQRNDYLGWIDRAKQEKTRRKRLDQMLAELEAGDAYMSMEWRPKRGSSAGREA